MAAQEIDYDELDGMNLRNPVLLIAFSGWNDAGDAATAAIAHLTATYPNVTLGTIDGEDYLDFQVNRPEVKNTADGSKIIWPGITLTLLHQSERDLILMSGPEPNFHWRAFTCEVLDFIRACRLDMVVLLGAMLTDAPHSRPLPVSVHTSEPYLGESLGCEPTDYEGPTGMPGVLAEAIEAIGIPTVSLWVSVPHYVASPPNPKATQALILRLEEVLDISLDSGRLPELTALWEERISELAAADPEIAEYIEDLEEKRDRLQLPDSIGNDLADEFERYLRGQD